jgi:hypothetical protein
MIVPSGNGSFPSRRFDRYKHRYPRMRNSHEGRLRGDCARYLTAFLQEYDRCRTIPRAATWPMAEGLAEPNWLNLAKKPTNHMITKVWFITGANRGLGAEIAKKALAAGTSLPSQASVASWPSLKSESRCFCAALRTWLLDLISAL